MSQNPLEKWLAEHAPQPHSQPDSAELLKAFSALTSPDNISPEALTALVRALIDSRPSEERATLHHGIAADILRAMGMGMNGLTVQDPFTDAPGKPDKPGAQNTFFVSPYPRFTAGAAVVPTCRDAQGEIYVLLVRDKTKLADGTVTPDPVPNWHLCGGFMDACDPATHNPELNPDGRANPGFPNRRHDANLQEAALRELREETGLVPPDSVTPHLIQMRSGYRPPRHHLSACFWLDFGQCETFPTASAQEETFDVRWVNVRDISHTPNGGLQTSVDGTLRPIASRHLPDIGEAVTLARKSAKPGFDCPCPPFSPEAQQAFATHAPTPEIAASTARHEGSATLTDRGHTR